MKFIKLLFIFTLLLFFKPVFSQDFVDNKEALIRLELHQSDKAIELSGGVISDIEYNIVENFIIDLVSYISGDVDVPESLNASFETMLNLFQNDQEMVVTVRDNIQTALTKE
jgi:hypothetical protein